MHDITEGGILGALWEVAEAGHTGIDIDRNTIPLREETARICEAFSVNPLRIMSSGSLLIVAKDGNAMARELQKQGIPASVIGKTTEDKARILRGTNTMMALTPPEPDELYTALQNKKA